jgi:hypothetical protein
MAGSNVVPIRTRKPKASDIIEHAILSGKKLPLTVMFERLWDLEAEILRLEASDDFDSQVIARTTRDRLFRVAEAIAPYVHAKVQSTVISGDPDHPIVHEHSDRLRFESLTNESAQKFLDALNSGEMTMEEFNEAMAE